MPRRVVDVLVPVALDRAYSYRVPDKLELAPGDVVTVPLGAREATAVVWADNPKPNPRLDNRLKDIEEKLEVPPLKSELRSFVDWVSNYTLSSRGMVLRMCLRMGEHLGAERERVGVRLVGAPPARMTAARARVLELLADGMVRAKSEAAREAGVSLRRDRRSGRRRHAGNRRAAVTAGRGKARSRFCAAGFFACAARRRGGAENNSRQGRLFGHAARRSHRLGQDRSLFRGGGGRDPQRPAEPDPDAGDRAHRAVLGPLRRALRPRSRRNGIRCSRRAGARAPGAPSPTTKSRSWSARARRCFCPTPISG